MLLSHCNITCGDRRGLTGIVVSYIQNISRSLHDRALLECMLPQLLNCINVLIQSIMERPFNLRNVLLRLLIGICNFDSIADQFYLHVLAAMTQVT